MRLGHKFLNGHVLMGAKVDEERSQWYIFSTLVNRQGTTCMSHSVEGGQEERRIFMGKKGATTERCSYILGFAWRIREVWFRRSRGDGSPQGKRLLTIELSRRRLALEGKDSRRSASSERRLKLGFEVGLGSAESGDSTEGWVVERDPLN